MKTESQMLANLKECFSRLTMLRPGPFFVGLQIKAPLVQDAIMRGFNRISSDFPELQKFKYEKEEDQFELENVEDDISKNVSLRLTNGESLVFMWGNEVDFDLEPGLKKLLGSIKEGFGIYPINIGRVDIKLFFHSNWEGNHYEVMRRAFRLNTPLAGLFEPTRLFHDEVTVRGIIGEGLFCMVGVDSDVAAGEVLRNSFKDDLLNAYAAFADMRGLTPDSDVFESFRKLVEAASRFVKEKFLPNVLEPLDRALAEVARAGDR